MDPWPPIQHVLDLEEPGLSLGKDLLGHTGRVVGADRVDCLGDGLHRRLVDVRCEQPGLGLSDRRRPVVVIGEQVPLVDTESVGQGRAYGRAPWVL